jgi:hypothetical protein
MLENDLGLARQEVRFELNEAQRKLENIGTLSGRYLSLAHLKDTSTPLGHQVPGLCHNIIICSNLLSGYEQHHGGAMTFADLRRMDPSVHAVFCKAIQQVRQFDTEIQYQVACERLGRKP